MATGKVNRRPSEERHLEQIDLAVEPRSVVVSVRLDPATARQIMGIAKREKRRVSDVLRDAAAAYASTASTDNLFVSGENPIRRGTYAATYARVSGDVHYVGPVAETFAVQTFDKVVRATRHAGIVTTSGEAPVPEGKTKNQSTLALAG